MTKICHFDGVRACENAGSWLIFGPQPTYQRLILKDYAHTWLKCRRCRVDRARSSLGPTGGSRLVGKSRSGTGSETIVLDPPRHPRSQGLRPTTLGRDAARGLRRTALSSDEPESASSESARAPAEARQRRQARRNPRRTARPDRRAAQAGFGEGRASLDALVGGIEAGAAPPPALRPPGRPRRIDGSAHGWESLGP